MFLTSNAIFIIKNAISHNILRMNVIRKLLSFFFILSLFSYVNCRYIQICNYKILALKIYLFDLHSKRKLDDAILVSWSVLLCNIICLYKFTMIL